MNSTKELIEEIEKRIRQDSVAEYGLTGRKVRTYPEYIPVKDLMTILNSHSERIDTALMLLELVEKVTQSGEICNIRIGKYFLSFDEGELLYYVNEQRYPKVWHRVFDGSLSDCINFIKQQSLVTIEGE